jgi:hypothetical protein
VAASGVCHSDLHTAIGDVSFPVPTILGHEGAGVAVTDRHYPDQIHRFAFMPAVIPAANHVIMEIAGLMRIQLDPA